MRTSDIPLDLGDFVIAYATAKNRFDLLMERPSDASIEDCASLGVREIRRLRNAEHLPRGIRKFRNELIRCLRIHGARVFARGEDSLASKGPSWHRFFLWVTRLVDQAFDRDFYGSSYLGVQLLRNVQPECGRVVATRFGEKPKFSVRVNRGWFRNVYANKISVVEKHLVIEARPSPLAVSSYITALWDRFFLWVTRLVDQAFDRDFYGSSYLGVQLLRNVQPECGRVVATRFGEKPKFSVRVNRGWFRNVYANKISVVEKHLVIEARPSPLAVSSYITALWDASWVVRSRGNGIRRATGYVVQPSHGVAPFLVPTRSPAQAMYRRAEKEARRLVYKAHKARKER